MNFAHLRTITWLRWRLMANQLLRMGKANRLFTLIIIILAMLGSLALFFLGWLQSGDLFEKSSPSMLMLIWSGMAVAFLFGWSIGVITDLQRREPLSLDKFLQLPVSPGGAFLMNFLSSFISISMIMMFPIMLGLSFGMLFHYGPRMIVGVLLLLAFILLIVALTYQFRGWLAAIMMNKRRRRTVVTALTLIVIVVSQIPNLLSMTVFREQEKKNRKRSDQIARMEKKWNEDLEKGEITPEKHAAFFEEVRLKRKAEKRQQVDKLADWVRIPATAIPLGWMPLGIEKLARGKWLMPLVFLLGLLGLSAFSLYRSYHTTLRLYRGDITRQSPVRSEKAPEVTGPYVPTLLNRLVGKRIPFLNEHQSAVAGSCLVSIARAPEAKLALFTPFLIMLLIGASFAFRDTSKIPDSFRPFTGIGVVTFAMLGILGMLNNQFGYDRNGFRCYVLSPMKRKDILLGKNMALAPFAISIGAIGIVAVQFFMPMELTHFAASFIQLGSIFLITCMIGNLMSIHAPLAVAAGSMKPMNLKLSVVVMQLLITMLLPIGLLPVMLPPGVEFAARHVFGIENIPIYLLLSILLFFVVLLIYRKVIAIQSHALHEREQDILEIVTQVGT